MITFSTALPEDVPQMVEVFYQTWLATYPNELFGITREDIEEKFKDAFTDEDIARRKHHMLETAHTTYRVVVKERGSVIGLAALTKKEDCNELQSLYVLPDYQGQGIGTRLWQEVVQFAEVDKDIVVFLATYNTQAMRFYEQLGFVDTGVRDTNERHRMPVSKVLIPIMKMCLAKEK